MDENTKNFIIELEALSKKYGKYIWGCACCGSPSIEDLSIAASDESAGYAYEDELRWVSKDDSYNWNKLGDKIVGKK